MLPTVGRIIHYYLTEKEEEMYGRIKDTPRVGIITAFDSHAYVIHAHIFIPGVPTPMCKVFKTPPTGLPVDGHWMWPVRT